MCRISPAYAQAMLTQIAQLRRHGRQQHPGASTFFLPILCVCCAYANNMQSKTPTSTISVLLRVSSAWSTWRILSICSGYVLTVRSALRAWVRSGGWKNARFAFEPGYVPRMVSAYAPLIPVPALVPALAPSPKSPPRWRPWREFNPAYPLHMHV